MQVSIDAFYTGIHPDLNICWEEVLFLGEKMEFPRKRYLKLNTTSCFYYIKDGSLSFILSMENGQKRIINPLLKSGTLINVAHSLASQLTDFIEKDCYFYCLTDTILYKFDRSLLFDNNFVCKYPHLITNLMASLGVKILVHLTLLSYSGTGTAKQQLCRFFYYISKAHNDATQINPNISQTELANILGINRATLVRTLQELKQDNIIIEFNKNKLVIGNLDKLAAIAFN